MEHIKFGAKKSFMKTVCNKRENKKKRSQGKSVRIKLVPKWFMLNLLENSNTFEGRRRWRVKSKLQMMKLCPS